MPAGLTVTKAALDQAMGEIAQNVNIAMENVRQMQEWLGQQVDADLEANYGYSAADVANMKSAFADLDQLRRIYEGGQALPAAKDFRSFAKLLWGLGFA